VVFDLVNSWEVPNDPQNPVCIRFSAEPHRDRQLLTEIAPQRIRIAQGDKLMLLAAGEDASWGLLSLAVDSFSILGPISAEQCRSVRLAHPIETDWWTSWAVRFARELTGHLCQTRPWQLERAVVTSDRFRTQVPRLHSPFVKFVDDDEADLTDFPMIAIDWSMAGENPILPMRRIGNEDSGRLKALTKLAATNELPPALLWWHSGIQRHLVLDGHVRLAAFREAGMPVRVLLLSGQRVPRYAPEFLASAIERAEEIQHLIDDPSVRAKVTAALFTSLPGSQATTTAKPLTGGSQAWDREAHDHSPEFLTQVYEHLGQP
jgi:hypothetical protein